MEAAIIFVVFMGLLLIRVPIAFSMGVSAIAALLFRGVPLYVIPQRVFNSLDSFTLLSLPVFIFVGEAMNTAGITDRIFGFAKAFVGHIKGGLGHVNVLASVIFAGMSGSALSDAYGLGTIEIKAMEESGFDTDFSAAITAASSTIGPIIPPSLPLVVFAVIAEQSIGRLFLGGIIPGLLMAISLMVIVYFISKKRGYRVEPKATLNEKIKTTISAIPSLLTPVLLLSGIVFGVFTPTEGAVVAALYAVFLGLFIHKELKPKDLYPLIVKTVKNSAAMLIIVASASVLTWLILSSDIPQVISDSLFAITQNKYLIIFLINIALLILGCFLEGTALITIMVPVLLPIMNVLGIDLVHFGVILVLNVMLGAITPPVGLCLYVVCNITKISIGQITKAIIPFMVPLFVVLILISYIPELVLFLPNLVMGK